LTIACAVSQGCGPNCNNPKPLHPGTSPAGGKGRGLAASLASSKYVVFTEAPLPQNYFYPSGSKFNKSSRTLSPFSA